MAQFKTDLKNHLSAVDHCDPQGSKTPQLYRHIGEWKKFENMFHFVAEMCQWTEQGKLEKLKACLQNQGITYLRTLPPGVASNYQDLVQQLRQQFQEAEIIEACRRQLLGIRQQVDVSSKQVMDRIRGLASTTSQDHGPAARAAMDDAGKDRFLHGLEDRTWATTSANNGPLPNIQATLEAAKDVDAIQKYLGQTSLGHPESGRPPAQPATVSTVVAKSFRTGVYFDLLILCG